MRSLSLALIPQALIAEVCDKEQPLWDGNGPVTVLTDPFWTVTNPFVACLVFLAAIALWNRNRWWTIPLSILWLLVTAALTTNLNIATDPIAQAARREGCIGPPHLSIALSGLLTLALIRAAILGPRKP